MPVNNPVVIPTVRHPRSIVKVNGLEAPAMIEWQTDANNYYRANTFRVEFALEYPGSAQATINAAWWADQADLLVEIYAGFPSDPAKYTTSDLEKIFVGEVDELTTTLEANLVVLEGRDLSLRFIETKTTEKYPNMTASEIVKKLADDKGVKTQITDTSEKVGRFYNEEHVQLQDERTMWDLMCFLAQSEQYVLFLKGDVLHFEPAPAEDSSNPYVLVWKPPGQGSGRSTNSANFVRMNFKRSLTISRDVIVQVRSWNSKEKKSFTTEAKASKNQRRQSKGGDAQTYAYTIPGLTKEQSLKKAQSLLEDISRHEIRMTASLPADNIIDESTIIQVQGTGTANDQLYFADHVVRRFSIKAGYAMEIRAKNHSPISTVLA